MIPFHIPAIAPDNLKYVNNLLANPNYFISRYYFNKCLNWLQEIYTPSNIYLTNSCTSALEIICLAEGWKNGDEIIMPSFTYVSTANAFSKFGVTPVFADVDMRDMNISVESIIASITPKTKAIVVVHYGGVACNMDIIEAICQKNNLTLIEDAAHSFNCFHKNKRLGTIGSYGAISFDHTKNIHCGQGGALIVNDSRKVKKVATVFENGTNREEFLNKDVPYFEWVSLGSKYALSELNTAFLLPQLESSSVITEQRVLIWNNYYELLKKLSPKFIDLPVIPEYAKHNGHIFYIKLKNQTERNNLKAYLGENNIQTAFHFIPLHNSEYGKKHAIIKHQLINTELESERLLRLPIYHGMNKEDVSTVVKFIRIFFES